MMLELGFNCVITAHTFMLYDFVPSATSVGTIKNGSTRVIRHGE